MKTIKSTKGFTLVELIVVIAILMVLSVLAVTAFGNVMGQAQDAARRADAQALIRNLNMFNSFATDTTRVRVVAEIPRTTDTAAGTTTVRLSLDAGPPPDGAAVRGIQHRAGITMPFMITMEAARFTELTGDTGIRIFPTGTGDQLLWTVIDGEGNAQPTLP